MLAVRFICVRSRFFGSPFRRQLDSRSQYYWPETFPRVGSFIRLHRLRPSRWASMRVPVDTGAIVPHTEFTRQRMGPFGGMQCATSFHQTAQLSAHKACIYPLSSMIGTSRGISTSRARKGSGVDRRRSAVR